MTKSSMSLFGNAIRPCTASSHSVSPSLTRKRTENGIPDATRRAISSGASRSQRRSYLKLSLRAVAACLMASSSACGAEASVRGTSLEQEIRIALMTRESERLVDDLLVPVEAEPLESLEDRALALVGAASLVRVLDAKEECAAGLARIEPVEESRARAAHVEVSGGRRREANTRWGERIGHGPRKRAKKGQARRSMTDLPTEREGFEPSIGV